MTDQPPKPRRRWFQFSLRTLLIDGDFPREVLAGQNLVFSEYKMPARRNTPEYYDVKSKKPAGKRQGVLKLGQLDYPSSSQRLGGFRLGAVRVGTVVSLMLALALMGMTLARRRRNSTAG